jgi:putative endonuclease
MNTTERGRQAEQAAADYVASKGYRILTRNFKTRRGEIDIVAEKENVLIFIEVRSRQGVDFGLPQETVNRKKRQKIRMTAAQYLKQYQALERLCRFDVVGVVFGAQGHIQSIELIPDAF